MSAPDFFPQNAAAERPRRRGRKRMVAALLLVVLAIQAWVLMRNTGEIRAVVYNDGPGPVAEVVLRCANERVEWDGMEEEGSRFASFRPAERSDVLLLAWVGAEGPHSAVWAVERGERLTVRVGGGGAAQASRERSLGRRMLDFVANP